MRNAKIRVQAMRIVSLLMRVVDAKPLHTFAQHAVAGRSWSGAEPVEAGHDSIRAAETHDLEKSYQI